MTIHIIFHSISSLVPVSIVLLLLSCLATAQDDKSIDPRCSSDTSEPVSETIRYTLKEGNNITCLVAQFSASIMANGQCYVLGPKINQGLSTCGNTTQSRPAALVVDFGQQGSYVRFLIESNRTFPIFISSIDGLYNEQANCTFKNTSVATIFRTTQSGHYYKCDVRQPIVMNVNNASNAVPTTLLLSNFALEAFRTVSTEDFYQITEECQLDAILISDWVRIGVGVCMVALVAIVLIAYFIGRRRWSERSSYESV